MEIELCSTAVVQQNSIIRSLLSMTVVYRQVNGGRAFAGPGQKCEEGAEISRSNDLCAAVYRRPNANGPVNQNEAPTVSSG
jgi:hypothetical protein